VTEVQMMDRATADGLANLLVVVGDNKHWMARWLSEWAVGAPGLESSVAAAAIAQGHFGQARALFPFVEQYLADHDLEGPEERERRYNVAALDQPFGSWAQAVVTLFLVDNALNVVLRSVQETQPELERRIGRVLDESRFYRDFAAGRLADLTRNWEHGRGQIEPHLVPVLTEMLCWFGPPEEVGVEHLVTQGVLTLDNDGMRDAFLDDVAPTLLGLGYDLPVEGHRGAWTWETLPWDRWNSLQRRLETAAT
jgi:ring-1,2-phenylacetyl-CoA epoxidase subunit PaaC